MQFRSLWYIWHAPSYCFVLLYVTLYYFVLLCIVLHSKPYRPYGPYTLWPLRHALCHHYMWFWSLGEHMPDPSSMQFCNFRGICHAIITCHFWACGTYGTSSLHAVLGLARHMPCHHYMQIWSAQGTCHTIIKCNFWAYEAYAMPSAITLHCLVILCTTLYYFTLHCTLSLTCLIGPKPCGLQDMYHILIICSPIDWEGICHALITCSCGACNASAMPSSMQFLSLWHMSHALITCSCRACRAHAMSPLHASLEWIEHTMPSLNAISELVRHMPCTQRLLHTDLH